MKSIKELEADGMNGRTYNADGYLQALKDVLELIDERIKKLRLRLKQEKLPLLMQTIISAKVRELEELKARITG